MRPVKKEKPAVKKPTRPKAGIFTKTGIIAENEFIKINFTNPEEINLKYDALVITASMGVELVKEYCRKNPERPVIVLKGDANFIRAGADKCVSRINQEVIDEITLLSNKIKKLQRNTEIDPITGLKTRTFVEEWKTIQELRNKHYSLILLRINGFKTSLKHTATKLPIKFLLPLQDFLKKSLTM
ncbi:MAG TPA: hypothetical protein P5158_07930 [Chitinophagaceae bacterium]|nr:hypothetical protein [Chitinophagaceae bacterium]